MKNTTATAAIATIIALLAGACSGPQKPASSGDETPYQVVVSRTDITGKKVAHDRSKQAHVVIVFASWCSACRRELQILSELVRERPALRVIGVNAYEEYDDLSDQRKLEAFLTESHPWLTVVRADDRLLQALGGVTKVPTLFLYDAAGAEVEVYRPPERRPPDKRELEAALARMSS